MKNIHLLIIVLFICFLVFFGTYFVDIPPPSKLFIEDYKIQAL